MTVTIYAYGGTTLPRLQRDVLRRVSNRVKPLDVPTLALIPVAPCEPQTIVITGANVITGIPASRTPRYMQSNNQAYGQEDVALKAQLWGLNHHDTRERLILEGYILTEHQMILYTERKKSYDNLNRRKRSIAKKFEQFDQDYQELKRMVRNGSKPVSELANLLSNS